VSTDTLYEQLRGHLHYLKLAAIADALAPALEHAEREHPGYTAFLHGLLETEVDATEQRRLRGRLRFSKLPARKTLAQFDHDAQPSLDRRMIDELGTLRFIAEKATSGTGRRS
jgi:DNA replication protein DnaC